MKLQYKQKPKYVTFTLMTSHRFGLKSFMVGPLGCNCSLIWDLDSKDAIVVDPGDDFERIQTEIRKEDLKVQGIIHTHAHFDHIGASKKLNAATQAQLYLHPQDDFLWKNLSMQGRAFGLELEEIGPWQEALDHEKEIPFGKLRLKTLYTPGHTPGSCCFQIGELVFAGDTLFRDSIGRTDLWGGDFRQLEASIKERLYTLDDESIVITGHGPQTNIGYEKRNNPFVKK